MNDLVEKKSNVNNDTNMRYKLIVCKNKKTSKQKLNVKKERMRQNWDNNLCKEIANIIFFYKLCGKQITPNKSCVHNV